MTSLVVRVGGSLYDWPELGPRLARWLTEKTSHDTLLVPGGGMFTDQVRRLAELHRLDDETAHWLALKSMTVAAGFLDELLEDSGYEVDFSQTASVLDCTESWHRKDHPILDAYAFRDYGDLPQNWSVTSDSIAARLAELLGADLILLKSADPPAGDVAAWSAAGYVDPYFPTIVNRAKLVVRAINLRTA
jgi:5-(aminomethyl)-3-furanmethanol phosphate kinase